MKFKITYSDHHNDKERTMITFSPDMESAKKAFIDIHNQDVYEFINIETLL